MLYLYLSLPVLLLVAVTILFLYSLKSSGISGNAQLLVDAWSSVADSGRIGDLSPKQEEGLNRIPSGGSVTTDPGQMEQLTTLADISKFSYQNRCRG